MAHAINWFEIPVKDFKKAKTFYETILGATMQTMEAMGMKSAFFPADLQSGSIGGCIMEGRGYEPSNKGSLVYLNGGDDLSVIYQKLNRQAVKLFCQKLQSGPTGSWRTLKIAKETKLDFTQ